MGLLGKMKNAITGGGANVTIEYPTNSVKPGEKIHVKVTVTSTGSSFKTKGVFVDLKGEEHGSVTGSNRCDKCGDYDKVRLQFHNTTYDSAIPLSGGFSIGESETKNFEGDITIPSNAQPTYFGTVKHEWSIRGRVEAFGNDPDSGFQPIIVK